MNNNRRKKTTPLFALLFGWMLAACSDDDNGGPDPNTEWEITMTVDLPKADTVKVHTLIQWDEVPLEDWETPLIYWNGSGQPGETLPRHYYEAGRHTFSIRGKGRVIPNRSLEADFSWCEL